MGTQFALEAGPIGGRMRVVEMRALAVKTFAAVLFLVRACGDADVGLRGELTLLDGVHGASTIRIGHRGGAGR